MMTLAGQSGDDDASATGEGDHSGGDGGATEGRGGGGWLGYGGSALEALGRERMRAGPRDRVLGASAAAPGPAPQRERKQGGNLGCDAARLEQSLVDPGQVRLDPTRLTVSQVAADLTALADPEGSLGLGPGVVDDTLDL
jgi:hypothetical protein